MVHILVTGANGQLGRCLRKVVEIAQPKDYKFHFTTSEELDITNQTKCIQFCSLYDVKVIINCAAYVNVEKAETDKEKCFAVNEAGVKNLAIASKLVGATLIHISTDYVFDGKNNIAYTETDEVNPLNVYGQSKWAGERAISHVDCKAIVIRTSWLYSEYGTNFVKTMIGLLGKDKNINVTIDQIGTPTYAGSLAIFLYTIITTNAYITNRGLYHYSDEGVASWYDFAQAIKELYCPTSKVQILPAYNRPTQAVRPQFSVLDKTKISQRFKFQPKHWRERLQTCINNIKQSEQKNESTN